jgi:hypothetical protein
MQDIQAFCFCYKPDIHCPVAVSHNLFWIVIREVAFTKLENACDKKKTLNVMYCLWPHLEHSAASLPMGGHCYEGSAPPRRGVAKIPGYPTVEWRQNNIYVLCCQFNS